jgi:hypothetical protein
VADLGIPTAVPRPLGLDTVLSTDVGEKGWIVVGMQRRGVVLMPMACFEILR